MSTNIDSLTIKVDAQVDGAINRLTQLNNVLVTLQQNSGLGRINQQLNKISAKGVTNSINNAKKAVENLNNTKVDKLSNSLNSLRSVTSGVMGVIKSGLTIAAGIQFSKPISAINDYVENLNLFKVAMGDNYEEAYEYANLLEDKMGIDSSEWMRNQGIIQSMANGFGIAKDKAYQFSKGMTEVAYDLSSFYNLPIDVAMQKIESGIAGEIEPLRRLGFALSEASLQEVAMAHGLDTNIRAMSEAEKAQLRYIAIVEQAGAQGAIGDFAKTLSSPANALRILSQQVQQLARAVGSVFIPILTAVLPYIQAFVSIVTDAIRALASLVGFKLPDWSGSSWSGVEAGSAAVSDNMGTAAKNAKKLQDNIQGFDELHTLDDDTSSGGGGGGGVSGGGIGDLTMPSVWGESMIAGINSQVDAITEKIYSAFSVYYSQPYAIWNSEPIQAWQKWAVTATNFSVNLFKSVGTNIWNNLVNSFDVAKDNIIQGFNNISTLITLIFTDFTNSLTTWSQPIINGVTNLVNSIWLGVIDPAIQGLSQLWSDFTASLLATWQVYGKPLIDNIGAFVVNTINLFQSIWDNVISPIIMPFLEELSALWNEHLKYVIQDVTDLVANLINSALEIYNEFIVPVITWVHEKLAPVWNFLSETVATTLGAVLSKVDEVIGGITEMFGGVIDFITGVFTGDWEKAWEGVKKIFSGLWESLKGIVSGVWDGILNLFSKGGKIFSGVVGAIGEVFKKIVNSIIKGINWVIRQPFNFINGILNTIKEISILGMQPFYGFWGYNPLPVPQIPLLAQGGYVGANDPRLAVIGDNKRYGEIVAPENKIYDISYEAFKDAQGEDRTYEAVYNAVVQALQDNPINADVYIDGTKMTKKMAQINRKLERQVGKNVFVG
jgi:phage-related protein